MGVIELSTPLTEARVRSLRVGDQVTLSGTIWGLRDATLMHWHDRGNEFPADLTEAVLLHTQPNVRRDGERYVATCVGTTTSQRMDRFTRAAAMAEHGCVYLAVVGGAASVETLQVDEIEEVHWEHLMPECLWKFRFTALGPLFVAIDTEGDNLHERVTDEARSRLAALL
jgi:L(+)-tartrate dehydratase beta subunit